MSVNQVTLADSHMSIYLSLYSSLSISSKPSVTPIYTYDDKATELH
jgi:hypothetical protein